MGKTKSILTNDMDHCYVCGSSHVVTHHIFYGTANRIISDRYHCVAPLCGFHHNQSGEGVHFNKALDLELKALCQEKFEQKYPDLDFVKIFGRDFINQFISWRENNEQGNSDGPTHEEARNKILAGSESYSDYERYIGC